MKCARFIRMLVFSLLFALAEMPMFAQGAGQDSGAAPQYEVTCAGCHGLDGSGSAKGPAIATIPRVIALSDDDLIRICARESRSPKLQPAIEHSKLRAFDVG